MSERIYLDWNATAPLRPQARAAMLRWLDMYGNASSVHGEGRAARQLVERAREQVAALAGTQPRNVVFTSGGTEANMLALAPGAGCDRLLVSAIEHPSVRSGGRFAADAVTEIPVTGGGLVDLGALGALLAQAERVSRPLVAIMLANNETGSVQPIREAADLVHAAGGILHVDAVQAAGRIELDINALHADLLSLSAHKMGGPQGVGALIRRNETVAFPTPLLKGGGQERGLRAGTENVAGIAGFGAAAEAARSSLDAEADHMLALRLRVEAGLRAIAAQTVIFSADAERLPNTVLYAVPGIRAETALIALDLEGVAVSSGSACSSGKVSPSHVLAAMGVEPGLASGALRLSIGYSTTESDVERFLQTWRRCIAALGKGSREMAA